MNLAVFFEQFDRFADAPTGVQKMRELVLQLAVQGRLVEQKQSEGDAAPLLDAISRERGARSTRARPLTRSARGDGGEQPFRIPPSWAKSQLGNIALQIQYGYTASADHSATEIRMLRITDIQYNRVHWPSVPGCQIEEDEVEKYLLHPNDILIARTGGTIGKSFIVPKAPVKSVFASYLIRVTPPTSMEARYLKVFFESPLYWAQLRAMSTGTGQPNVNGQALGRLAIPLPPLGEQRRIVEQVDRLMTLCDRLETQQEERETRKIALARAALARFSALPDSSNLNLLFSDSFSIEPAGFRKTILSLAVQGKLIPQRPQDEPAQQLLKRIEERRASSLGSRVPRKTGVCRPPSADESPQSIPNTWVWAKLGEITDIGTGSTPSRTEASFWRGGSVPWITSGSTSKSPIMEEDELVTPEAVTAHRLRIYPAGTLLVALYGQGKTRGQVATLGIPATINQACAAVCAIDGIESMQDYLKLVLEKQYDEMRLLAAGGAQPNLNVQKIKERLVPLPPIAEQTRIVARVAQLMTLVHQLEEQTAASQIIAANLLEALAAELTGALGDGSVRSSL